MGASEVRRLEAITSDQLCQWSLAKSLRGQAPEHQARELRGRCLDHVEIVLKQEWIHVRLDDQEDCMCRLIQRRLTLELASFSTLAQDVDQDLLDALGVCPSGRPSLTGRRRSNVVELSVVEKQSHAGGS